MTVKIISDSTCDLPKDLLEKYRGVISSRCGPETLGAVYIEA